jgi:hypothetical protein
MRLIRVATSSIGFLFTFAAVALGQPGNWFEPIAALPKPDFPEYHATAVPLESGEPSLFINGFALASLPAGPRAQNEIPIAKNTMNESLAAWKPTLRPGIFHAAGQPSVKPWSMAKISAGSRRAGRQSWIRVGPGSLPLAITIQPGATQKYGADPATLQIYFGHRP